MTLTMNCALRDSLRESYDRKAHDRDASGIQTWKAQERESFLALLRQEHKRSLLEIGAGPGKDARFFQDQGLQVTCIDLSPEMVKLCRQKGLDAHVMDLADLHALRPAESFDAVYALNCLLHIPKHELPAVLCAVHAVLKPAGLFYLGVYGGYDHEGAWEQDTYTPQRFFSFYTDEHLQQVTGVVFDTRSFKHIPLDGETQLHFQSLTLKKS